MEPYRAGFFLKVEQVLGYKWRYTEYFAVLSINTLYSFASPYKEFEQRVLLDMKWPKYAPRILAHELLHQYINQLAYYDLDDERLENPIFHELLITHVLFDTEINELFTDDYTPERNLLDPGHAEAHALYETSRDLWIQRKDFDDYKENLFALLDKQ